VVPPPIPTKLAESFNPRDPWRIKGHGATEAAKISDAEIKRLTGAGLENCFELLLHFLEERGMAYLLEKDSKALLDPELLALALRVKEQVANHHAQGGERFPAPSWATKCIKELSTAHSGEPDPAVFLSPFGKKPTGVPNFDSTLDDDEKESTYGSRAYEVMNRISVKAKSKKYTYFSEYDEDSPMSCFPETVSETERRIYVWSLLKRIFYKTKAMFQSIRPYDCKTVITYSFNFNFLAPIDEGDQEYKQWMEITLLPHERYQDLFTRMEALVEKINIRGEHPIAPKHFRTTLLRALSANSNWEAPVSTARFENWNLEKMSMRFTEYAKTEHISQRKFTNSSQTSPQATAKAAKRKEKKKKAKLLKAASATATATATATGNDDLIAIIKAMQAKSGGAPKAQVKSRECYTHKRWGTCPDGLQCPFVHDNQNGRKDDTTCPDKFVCLFCAKNHWSVKCNSQKATDRKLKADDYEAWRAQRRADWKLRQESGKSGIVSFVEEDKFPTCSFVEENTLPSPADPEPVPVSAFKTEVKNGAMDSACSSGIFTDKRAFPGTLTELTRKVQIQCAGKEILYCSHGGTAVTYNKTPDGIWHAMYHPDSLYVPTASGNLISLARITNNLYKAVIHKLHLTLLRVDDRDGHKDEVVADIEAENYIFPMDFKYQDEIDLLAADSFAQCILDQSEDAANSETASFAQPRTTIDCMNVGQINHLRGMHHQGFHARRKCPDLPSGMCSCCAFGNAQMVKGEDDGTRVYDRPGQQMGLDAFGPVTPPDVFGNQYTFNAIDGATEYIQCWACKIPSEWRTGFNIIVAQAETLHNTSLDELRVLQQAQAVNLDEIDPKATSFSVKPPRDALPPRMKLAIVRTDCAGYFFEKEFVKDCEEKGIKLEKQTPRTHYLGGATESLNDPFARHVVSALKHGNAPMAFWTFAWYQNQLVKNLSLRRGRKHSPYELWHSMVAHDVKSMVARLRVLFLPWISHNFE